MALHKSPMGAPAALWTDSAALRLSPILKILLTAQIVTFVQDYFII